MERKKHHINDFDVIKHHLGELTASEDKRVIEWSHLNPKNLKTYFSYQYLIAALNDLGSLKLYSIKNAWQKLSHLDKK